MKPPPLQAHDRENVYYKQVKWTKGQPEDPGAWPTSQLNLRRSRR
jgi:hypothetical protein